MYNMVFWLIVTKLIVIWLKNVHDWNINSQLQTTSVKEAEIAKICESLTREMEKVVGELKKLMDKEKVAEEQERLRKIQVKLQSLHTACLEQEYIK